MSAPSTPVSRPSGFRSPRFLLLAALALVACLVSAVAIPLAGPLGLLAPRTYLILAENEDELRPAGGFITGVAAVTVSRARVTDFRLADANSVDDLRQVYPAPPEPLQRYMQSQMWLLRDANWSPDFPSSARQAAALYQLGQGVRVDGVVAFDEAALRAVLAVIGPVRVPGAAQPVTDANFLTLMRAAWSAAPGSTDAATWRTTRKDFMGPLARALLAQLKSIRDPRMAVTLASAIRQSLNQRDILVYLPDTPLSGMFARAGWDGAVDPGSQDYLRVVDANVGFNKVNAAIRERLSYSVDLTDPSEPAASLGVTYTNTVVTAKTCVQFGVANHSTQYLDYLQDCYWDYWRVLLPTGSKVWWAPANAVPGDELLSGVAQHDPAQFGPGEGGTTQLAGLFVLPTGQSHTTQLAYGLPSNVLEALAAGRAVYRLRVQKQPGTLALPLDLAITFPAAWAIQSTTLPASTQAPGQIHFSLSLETDLNFEVVFQHP